MKKISRGLIALIAVLISVSLLSGCGGQKEGEGTYTSISQEEAIKIMSEEEGFLILDVRTQEEFSEGHIPGAINIPVETIAGDEPEELPDKGQTILVYCRSGNRSKQASEKLAGLGYTGVLEFGGINTWTGDVVSD